MYDNLFTFCKIVGIGNFSKASSELQISQSTLSRRMQSLEEELHVKLIIRDANTFKLTTAGNRLYNQLRNQEAALQDIVDTALNTKGLIDGELKILLPTSLPLNLITPKIPEFATANPSLCLQIFYQNHEINIRKDDFDIAVIYNLPTQPSIKTKLLYSAKMAAYCTPQYVTKYGFLADHQDLSKHKYITPLRDHGERINKISLNDPKTNKLISIPLKSTLLTNSPSNNRTLVKTGEYISSDWEVNLKNEFASGEFVRVLPNYDFGEFKFYLIKRVSDDPRINLFAEFLENCFRSDIALQTAFV